FAQQAAEHASVVQTHRQVRESQFDKNLRHSAENLGFDRRSSRAHDIEIALIELSKASACRTVGSPYRLNLVSLEEFRQLVLILRDDARQRDCQVIPQRKVRFTALFVLTSLQDLENELVAFFSVLAEQRLDVFKRRCLQRLEPVALVHTTDHIDHVLTTSY